MNHRSKTPQCHHPSIKTQTSPSIPNPLPQQTNHSLLSIITAQTNEKLTPSTFPQWRAQFEALLIGYDLLNYVEGTLLCPSSSGTATDKLCKVYWVRHDKLILSAILASTSPSITSLIDIAKTSHEAWKKLKNLYMLGNQELVLCS